MATNSDNFDLTGWKMNIPVDHNGGTSGRAKTVVDLTGYEEDFFYDADDGAMVFRASVDGARTGNARYARTELREKDGSESAAWRLDEGGTLTATLRVDEVPKYNDGTDGRIVIGQLRGTVDELVRLYWNDGRIYFMSEHSGPDDKVLTYVPTTDSGEEPHVELGETFSYKIEARDETLTIVIYANGKVYESVTEIQSHWHHEDLNFKAGLYLGLNDSQGSGTGQVSFYGLDYSHTIGEGLDGLVGLDDGSGDNTDEETDGETDGDEGDPDTPPDTPIDPDIPVDDGEVPEVTAEQIGTGGSDKLYGTASNDLLSGLDGHDKLYGREGDDILKGGEGKDRLYGEAGDDYLFGGEDRDKIYGGEGEDHLYGGGDTDKIYGGEGDDYIEGGDGKDQLRGEDGEDTIFGGEGDDKLYGGDDNDFLSGDGGEDRIDAGAGDDVVLGGDGEDDLRGRQGNDTLYGGNDDDRLMGYENDDVLYGGEGSDLLYGNDGADRFAYTALSESTAHASGRDMIADFDQGEGDKIDLSAIDANSNLSGHQDFDFIGQAAFSKTEGELRYGMMSGYQVVEVDVDGDGAADFSIEVKGSMALSDDDFIL
ncbi:hypothetical protein FDK21_09195 [Cohaesibacter sp. CAU 1516]|uniref:polysaccharide lyase family 7 protein n=1 Tax=Cohaesibacter sp. CAU 1516 TaxID=2576038 RepID=UPI0010FF0FA4|nr:polysaccharide lyase family 7 protein [Cohaesibacter sp. CAU 1516]TLP47161.1 hypothetical protein FDK21_09195 [Cohaesibacter sp. CAU 1516]